MYNPEGYLLTAISGLFVCVIAIIFIIAFRNRPVTAVSLFCALGVMIAVSAVAVLESHKIPKYKVCPATAEKYNTNYHKAAYQSQYVLLGASIIGVIFASVYESRTDMSAIFGL